MSVKLRGVARSPEYHVAFLFEELLGKRRGARGLSVGRAYDLGPIVRPTIVRRTSRVRKVTQLALLVA